MMKILHQEDITKGYLRKDDNMHVVKDIVEENESVEDEFNEIIDNVPVGSGRIYRPRYSINDLIYFVGHKAAMDLVKSGELYEI